jgi:hypothetical protein
VAGTGANREIHLMQQQCSILRKFDCICVECRAVPSPYLTPTIYCKATSNTDVICANYCRKPLTFGCRQILQSLAAPSFKWHVFTCLSEMRRAAAVVTQCSLRAYDRKRHVNSEESPREGELMGNVYQFLRGLCHMLPF